MGTKTISIMDDVYGMLKANKLENESFSDEIRRILTKRKRNDLSEFFGIISDKEGKEMLEIVRKRRAMSREQKREKFKALQ